MNIDIFTDRIKTLREQESGSVQLECEKERLQNGWAINISYYIDGIKKVRGFYLDERDGFDLTDADNLTHSIRNIN